MSTEQTRAHYQQMQKRRRYCETRHAPLSKLENTLRSSCVVPGVDLSGNCEGPGIQTTGLGKMISNETVRWIEPEGNASEGNAKLDPLISSAGYRCEFHA